MVLIATILQTLFRGGKGNPSIIHLGKCSGGYWGVLIGFVVVAVVATLYSVYYLRREYDRKTACGYVFHESDLKFTSKITILLCLIAFIGGVMAAIVGIGGGVIFNPMLLEFGLPPQVASNTGMYLVVYTTFSNTFQFMINKALNYAWGSWLAIWVLIGTFVGLKIVNLTVKRTGRGSIIVFVLSAVLLLASLISGVYNGVELSNQSKDGEQVFDFRRLCN